jgi:hypothetical protein
VAVVRPWRKLMAPKALVIVSCCNERDTIGLSLEALYVQDHPLEDAAHGS